jgi:hypothetical protein
VTPTKPSPDLDALEEDCTTRLAQLREQQARMSPESLIDPAVKAELVDVESSIDACTGELRRIELARSEIGHREQEVQEEAEQTAREQAQRRAAKLQARVVPSLKAIDEAMATVANALAAHERITGPLAQELRAGGDRRPRVGLEPSRVQAALAWHLSRADVSRGLIELPPITGKPRPMVPEEAS